MEIWKSVRGFEGRYEVSNLGNVRSVDRYCNRGDRLVFHHGVLMRPGTEKEGYRYVVLGSQGVRKKVHRLVYEAFIGELDDSLVVDHINCNKGDNRVENLRQITSRENTARSKSSKYGLPRGVYKVRNGFFSKCLILGEAYYLGRFERIEDAKKAYDTALGEFLEYGVIPCVKLQRNAPKNGKKICSCCGKEKPLSEYYYLKSDNTYKGKCKECNRKKRLNKL